MTLKNDAAKLTTPIAADLHHSYKSGLEGVDKAHIAALVEEASRGSKFYENQQRRSAKLQQKVDCLRQKLQAHSASELACATQAASAHKCKVDAHLAAAAAAHVFVHIDMDAFFAAVETLDNPHYNDIPMAVGSDAMLSTANYAARKWGVSSAMPGFIAKKLCPQLLLLPPNFERYAAFGAQIRRILERYDPQLQSYSLDEASLCVDAYLKAHPETSTETLVDEIRTCIFQETQLTCSAGVACTRLLAKMCSNVRKPNAQFVLPAVPSAISAFLAPMPIRRLHGVGRVTETLLRGVFGATVCADVWKNAAEIFLLFGSFFIVETAYGCTLPSSSASASSASAAMRSSRKSMSCERTFSASNDRIVLYDELHALCRTLAADLQAAGLRGKTVTLKAKSQDFDVISRSCTLAHATNDAGEILDVAYGVFFT